LGLTARELTPGLVERIAYAAAETRSFQRAAIALKHLADSPLSVKTVARIAGEVGSELAALRDGADGALSERPEAPPVLAVVQCDGGRIRTRAVKQGPGVHGEAWRETKNACLLRMTSSPSTADPHPELPRAFRDPQQVAALAEKEPLLGLASPPDPAEPPERSEHRPRRLVRTCLASLAPSHRFGRQMEREAQQRRFFEASRGAFLGDGLPWNWSIWQAHFREFTPILDFIHVLSYLYRAALVLRPGASETWTCYEALARACWQGRAGEVIEALSHWLEEQGLQREAQLPEDDPRAAVVAAARYVSNNQARMDYPAYRRAGLPVTTALMESLVKEMNYRVKGTEMFWNDPEGAEAILQIRAAALSEDDRLSRYLAARPGSPFVRTTTAAIAA
jgi:hypothetical protein